VTCSTTNQVHGTLGRSIADRWTKRRCWSGEKKNGFERQDMAVTDKEQHMLLFLDTLTQLNALNYNSFCNMWNQVSHP